MARVLPVYVEYPVSIPANSRVELAVRGRSWEIIDLSGSSVQIQTDTSEASTCRKGIGVSLPHGEFFTRLTFINNGGAAATVTVAISEGDIKDQRFVSVTSIKTYAGDTMNTPAKINVTAVKTTLFTADTTRMMVIIQNKSTTDSVWVGDTNIDATNKRGIEIKPEGDITLPTSADIFGQCLATKNADVSLLEIKQ